MKVSGFLPTRTPMPVPRGVPSRRNLWVFPVLALLAAGVVLGIYGDMGRALRPQEPGPRRFPPAYFHTQTAAPG
jgi:hypothetical protein